MLLCFDYQLYILYQTRLQSINIILLLQLIFKGFNKLYKVTKSWKLHIFLCIK